MKYIGLYEVIGVNNFGECFGNTIKEVKKTLLFALRNAKVKSMWAIYTNDDEFTCVAHGYKRCTVRGK
jgi:hypothetical protein